MIFTFVLRLVLLAAGLLFAASLLLAAVSRQSNKQIC